MATHFSIFTWEIPWTEEPGGVPRVKHNLMTKLSPVPSIYLSVCLSIYLSVSICIYIQIRGLAGGSDGEQSACNAGDPGLMPGL